MSAIDNRVSQLLALMDTRQCDEVTLTQDRNLAWMFGTRNLVSVMGEPCFFARITRDGESAHIRIVTSDNEIDRLAETEFGHIQFEGALDFEAHAWHTPLSSLWPTGERIGSDSGTPNSNDLRRDIALLRLRLSPDQHSVARKLTHDVTFIVEEIASTLTPELTEWKVAGMVCSRLRAIGCEPLVTLVGSGSALDTHKHPLPRDIRIQDRCMISLGVRRRGVVTSVTRYVAFGSPTPQQLSSYRQLVAVDSTFWGNTHAGTTPSEILKKGMQAYNDAGIAAPLRGEHHPGGLGGFAPRELIAGKDPDTVLDEGMIAAWNPTAAGWKLEDIGIITETGVETLSPATDWPRTEVNGWNRPDILTI